MKARKVLSFISLILLATLFIAACGGTGTATPAATTAATATTGSAGATATTADAGATATTTAPDTGATATTAPSTTEGKILRIQEGTYPEVLDPHKISFSHEIAITSLVYEGLTKLDPELNIVGGGAESWTSNEDASVFTFTMRSGLTYSDGTPLTSEDYARALRRTLSPEVAGEYQYILFDIKGGATLSSTSITDTAALAEAEEALGISTPDPETLIVELEGPAPYFPSIMTLWVTYPVKEESIAAGENWHMDPKNHIGNGPYILETMEQDQRLTFKANENYWGGRPKLDGIEFLIIEDSGVALEAYRRGEVDIIFPDPSALPELREGAESAELLIYPQAFTRIMSFNLTKPPFDDVNVRKAFSMAFDRETWCNEIRNGDCVATLSWTPQGIPGAYEEDRFAFDPAAAKEALAASKYADNMPEIRFQYNSENAATKPRVEWIAGEIQEHLGVTLILEPVESATLVSNRKDVSTFPHVTFGGWIGDYPDPQNWISVNWHSSSDQAKDVGYSNPDLDAIIEQADAELDVDTRMDLYVQAGKLLVDDMPAVFTDNGANVFLVKPYVKGITTTASDSAWPGQWASLLTVDIQK